MSSDCRHHRTACRRGDLVGVSPRRATSVTTARGARLSVTIARFCSALHRRRRSGPVMTSTPAIAPSLAPVQTLLLAPVLTSPTRLRYARRPSPDGYGSTTNLTKSPFAPALGGSADKLGRQCAR